MGTAALAIVAAACGEGAGARQGASPTAPRLAGATTHVTVTCPTTMEYGTSATCTAYGYDASNVYTGSTVSSWSSSNTSLATVTSGGVVTAGSTSGTVTISAVIDGITGSASISVVAPYSNPTVSIGGPSSVRPNAECLWFATVTGGEAPFTYSWSQTAGTGYSDGADGYYATSSSSYVLSVTITDNRGNHASASKGITVSSSARICPL
jgi:hypothetical protein